MASEREPGRRELPTGAVPLPQDLAAFLRHAERVALLHGAEAGSRYVVKAPWADLRSLAGPIPVRLVHGLHDHPQAPVLRSVLTCPSSPASIAPTRASPWKPSSTSPTRSSGGSRPAWPRRRRSHCSATTSSCGAG